MRHGKCGVPFVGVPLRQNFCVESSSDVFAPNSFAPNSFVPNSVVPNSFVPNSFVIKTCDRLAASETCRRLRIRVHFENRCAVRGVGQTNWGQANEDRQDVAQPDSASSNPTDSQECDSSVALVASSIQCERPCSPGGGERVSISNPRATAALVEHLVRPNHGAACEGVRHFQPDERIQA